MSFLWRYLSGQNEVQNVVCKYIYGYKKDKLDERDKKRVFMTPSVEAPSTWSLKSKFPPVYDQGKLGSCTANGITSVFEYALIREQLTDFQPSRLFLYYNERDMEGTVATDSGAEIRDGIKTLFTLGVCPETDWPYDITQFAVKPPDECYKNAAFDRSVQYYRVDQTLEQLTASIRHGFPVVFGFTVFESFESETVADTGVMPMPQAGEKVLGGHCVVMVGYDNEKQAVLCRNSWSENWGDGGYFWMPYEFITNSEYCSDFWVVEKVCEGYPPKCTTKVI